MARIFIGCFVWGLYPLRAARIASAKVPNPTSDTSLSRRNPRFTAARTASVARSADALEVPLLRIFCTSSTRAALFMGLLEAEGRTRSRTGQIQSTSHPFPRTRFTEICQFLRDRRHRE